MALAARTKTLASATIQALLEDASSLATMERVFGGWRKRGGFGGKRPADPCDVGVGAA